VDQPAGYHTDSFQVDGLTAVAAREYLNPGFRIVLHRWRGHEALPDVVLCKPPRTDEGVLVSADRLNVLAGCQNRDTTPRNHYDVVVYSTITGQPVGHVVSEALPATWIVWNQRLVYFVPERAGIGDLSSAKPLYEWTLRSTRYLGPYPPSARRR